MMRRQGVLFFSLLSLSVFCTASPFGLSSSLSSSRSALDVQRKNSRRPSRGDLETVSVSFLAESDNAELEAQLRREEAELKGETIPDSEQYVKEGEDAVKITDYASSVRKGGLEGSVGQVPLQTPKAFSTAVKKILATVDDAINNLQPKDNLINLLKKTTLTPVNKMRQLENEIPYLNYLSALMKTACKDTQLKDAGDSTIKTSFPTCLIDYLNRAPQNVKQDLGKRLRAFLTDPSMLDKAFNLNDGLCIPTAQLLELPSSFCSDILEIVQSAAAFVKVSGAVQKSEVAHYGEEASMLSKKEEIARKIQNLKTILLFRDSWLFLAIRPLKVEAQHLVDVWYNDPVHKWRYSAGIIQWLASLGMFFSATGF